MSARHLGQALSEAEDIVRSRPARDAPPGKPRDVCFATGEGRRKAGVQRREVDRSRTITAFGSDD